MLAYTLTKIINLLGKLPVFPEECKTAKLKPLFQKGSTTESKNYRPFHLYPSCLLMFETLDYKNFFCKANIQSISLSRIPTGNYMFEVNNRSIRKRC